MYGARFDTKLLTGLGAKLFSPLRVSARNKNFLNRSDANQTFENSESVSPHAEQSQPLGVFPRHVLCRHRHVGSRSQSSEGKTHESEQFTRLRIKERSIHTTAASQTTIGSQSYPDSTRAKESTGNHAERAMAGDGDMVRRVGNHLASRLLLEGFFGKFDCFRETQ